MFYIKTFKALDNYLTEQQIKNNTKINELTTQLDKFAHKTFEVFETLKNDQERLFKIIEKMTKEIDALKQNKKSKK